MLKEEVEKKFKMKTISNITLKLANKLALEGITKDNYSKEKALRISDRCCGLAILNYIIHNHESDIIDLLK